MTFRGGGKDVAHSERKKSTMRLFCPHKTFKVMYYESGVTFALQPESFFISFPFTKRRVLLFGGSK
jgi:hypothetical protein